ncbi:hypothetical protein ZWY2020_045300 [Hordeum vulgare]|nr:hypothetical protein ZWY2020_045300 [Hordeum vulgare]
MVALEQQSAKENALKLVKKHKRKKLSALDKILKLKQQLNAAADAAAGAFLRSDHQTAERTELASIQSRGELFLPLVRRELGSESLGRLYPRILQVIPRLNDHLIKCYSNRQVGRGKSRAAPSQSGTTIVHPQTPAVSSSGTPHAQGVSNSGRNPPQTNPAPLSCQHSKNNRGCTQPMFREKLSCQQVQSSAGAGMPSSNSTRAPMSKDPPVKNKAPMAASVGGKQGQPSNKGKTPLTSSSTTTLLSKQRQPNVCQDSSSSKPSKPSLKMKKKKKKYNLPGTKPPEEVMKYYRNSGRHGVDESVKDQQLQFGVKALNIILLFYFQKLLCSALRGIHRKNYLSRMETLPRVLR